MSSSREDSPDWVRSFKAPTRAILTLSSESDSARDDDDEDGVSLSRLFKKDGKAGSDKNGEDSEVEVEDEVTLRRLFKKDGKAGSDKNGEDSDVELEDEKSDVKQMRGRKRKRRDVTVEKKGKDVDQDVEKKAQKKSKPQETNHSLWMLSSDSESCPDDRYETEQSQQELDEYDAVQHAEECKVAVLEKDEKSPLEKPPTRKSPKKQLKNVNQPKKEKEENKVVTKENDDELTIQEEDTTEKQGPQVSSSRLPLVLPEKVQRTKALVECEGDSIDLSGDVGAVGRLMISDSPSGEPDMFLDLKGTIYKTTIVPSQTFCLVSFGQSEAKIEAIMTDFIQLKPQSNVYEAETMVEGTLEGFSFDSEEEADHPRTATGQNGKDEPGDEKPKTKGRPKGKAEKATGGAGKKAPKKAKKTHVPKKGKNKK